MELIQRYIQSVKSYLPAKLRDDVGEELEALLQDQYQDLREHSDDEEAEMNLLRRQGHPMLMAAKYQEPSALVSEALFPFYKLALTWMLGILIAVQVFTWAIAILQDQETKSLFSLVIDSFNTLILGFAYLTLAFHFFGKLLEKHISIDTWDPRRLPALRTDWSVMSRSDSIPALIGDLALLAFFNGVSAFRSEHVQLFAAPEFAALLPWVNVILLFSFAYHIQKIFQPLHTRVTTLFALTLTSTSLIVMGYAATLQSKIELHLGDKVFYPLPTYIIIIAMCVIFIVEGLPNIRRLRRML